MRAGSKLARAPRNTYQGVREQGRVSIHSEGTDLDSDAVATEASADPV